MVAEGRLQERKANLMFENLATIATALLLTPLGFCGMCVFQSFILYFIGKKENSAHKKRSAVRTLPAAMFFLVALQRKLGLGKLV